MAQLSDMDTESTLNVRTTRSRTACCGNVHGETGIDGPVFDELKRKAQDKNGVQFIIDTLMESV